MPAARKKITVELLRDWVREWPGVTEDVKWGKDLVFSVGGKMFCAADAGDGQRLSFKVEDGRFLELTDRPGVVPAPYLARAHWVCLSDPRALPATEVKSLLRRSYELVRAKLPKSAQARLSDASAPE